MALGDIDPEFLRPESAAVASNQRYEVTIQAFLRQERRHAGIEGNEFPLSVECQPQEIGIGYLLMTDDSRLTAANRIEQTDVIGPELMRRMPEVRFQEH